ncbi:MAG: hypothetical protein H6585_00390 [Flavobacteriales bacterium]|nr:hypothetical protein [Flavobacteriales bacterium]MCB9446783.1 hypothetical protein [Flavobacteriales bacterium]
MTDANTKCCDMMAYHSTHHCTQHARKYDCPDTLIDYSDKTGDYRLIIHDGGTSGIRNEYCPWCGSRLKK